MSSHYTYGRARVDREEMAREIENDKEDRQGIYGAAAEQYETDPDGKSAKTLGAKFDADKAPVFRGVLQYFPRSLRAVANLSLKGSKKYAWKGWETVPDGENRYGDAAARHILDEVTEGPMDNNTGELHATAVAWNALARLELILRREANTIGTPVTIAPHTYDGDYSVLRPRSVSTWEWSAAKQAYIEVPRKNSSDMLPGGCA